MAHFARVFSAQPHQLTGQIVTVEVDIVKNSLNKFSVVGMPDKAVDEARDRVGSALKNSHFPSPKHFNQKTVVSLSPAASKKQGAYFDLAIALGYLLADSVIAFESETKLFVGELSLNGEIQPISGALAIAQAAKHHGITELFVPRANASEAALVDGITVFVCDTLAQVAHFVTTKPIAKKQYDGPLPTTTPHAIPATDKTKVSVCFSDVKGQSAAKRALEIAAAGGHNAAMYGPPGTGKTMLAKAFCGILPELELDDTLEVTAIHSIAGTLKDGQIVAHPPLRSPHHTASYVAIIGGGSNPRPGEVTLAHKGVLFMDEFPEFDKRVLESLRQPLEDRVVNITRAKGSATFPTNFILIAAMNPPPKDATAAEIARHQRKISGPIMDRIDMWFPVEHVDFDKLSSGTKGETSIQVAKRVATARAIQAKRFSNSNTKLNAEMSTKDIEKLAIPEAVTEILNQSAKKLNLSPRSYHRVIKLAQTICDLDNKEVLEPKHILEALQYRPKHQRPY